MLRNVPPPYVKRNRPATTKPARKPTPPPVGPPVLVGASLDADGGTLTLVFDRTIDIGAYDGSTVVVDDAANHAQYLADTEVQRIDARSFRASLDYVGASTATQTQLTALAPTGVVAVEGGLAWAGVTGLALPFGS